MMNVMSFEQILLLTALFSAVGAQHCGFGDYSLPPLKIKNGILRWKIAEMYNEYFEVIQSSLNSYGEILNFTNSPYGDEPADIIFSASKTLEHSHFIIDNNNIIEMDEDCDTFDENEFGHVEFKDDIYEIHINAMLVTQSTINSIVMHLLGHVFGLQHNSDINSIMYKNNIKTDLSTSDKINLKTIYRNINGDEKKTIYISDPKNICRFVDNPTYITNIQIISKYIYIFDENNKYWKLHLDKTLRTKYDMYKKYSIPVKDSKIKAMAVIDFDKIIIVTDKDVYETNEKFELLKPYTPLNSSNVDIILNYKYGEIRYFDKTRRDEYLFDTCDETSKKVYGDDGKKIAPFVNDLHLYSFRDAKGNVYHKYKNNTMIGTNVYTEENAYEIDLCKIFSINCKDIRMIKLIEDYITSMI